MKSRHLWISIAAIVVFVFLLSPDAMARFAWRNYGRADIALILVRSDAKLTMELGNYYFGATIGRSEYNLEKAKRAYQKAVKAEDKILWGHYQIARIHFIKGDYEQALEEINKELAANPENLRSLYVRGLIYGYRVLPGDLEKAEQDFRRFTEWAPKEWAGYNDLAWVLSKLGKFKEAEETILAARREVPGAENNPWLWNSLGVTELNLHKYAQARSSFGKAKEFAQKLSLRDWRAAYPGNNPTGDAAGIKAFIGAIEENLRQSAVDETH